jgi:phosphatidylserine/phosphatidylglycerophosphate/cardiolipin synthase-like enzyme
MNYPFFISEKALRLSDDDYYVFLLDKIRHSQKYIYATIFIIDIINDRFKKIRKILDEITYAKWRGIDTKIIVGHSEKSLKIDAGNRLSFKYFRERGVPVKYCNPPDDHSLHSKYVIFDNNLVLVGSHNWSNLAMFVSKEDSIAIYSTDVVKNFNYEFNKLWSTGLEVLK